MSARTMTLPTHILLPLPQQAVIHAKLKLKMT